jgi:ferredoxin
VKVNPPYNYECRWECTKCHSKVTSEKRPDPLRLVKKVIWNGPGAQRETKELTCQDAIVFRIQTC